MNTPDDLVMGHAIHETFLNLIGNYSSDVEYNAKCWNEIERNYTAPSRHYHNLEHLENMLAELEEVKGEVENMDTLVFALFYHDVVYNAKKNDNEHQSALFLEKSLTKTSFPHSKEAMLQIELTKEHLLSDDHDTNILLDLDLSILGAPPEVYTRYAENIRKEYQMYPDFMYRTGRKKVLKSMLELPALFKTDFFKTRYEEAARENLRREIG